MKNKDWGRGRGGGGLIERGEGLFERAGLREDLRYLEISFLKAFDIERRNCKNVCTSSYEPSKLPLHRGLCYMTPNRLMDQVSFSIRFACVYSDIHNTPEHLTCNLYTALLCFSFAGATTVRPHTTFPLWKYLTLANCSSKNFCPWTLFLDFHSNTTLTNDNEIFLKFQWLQDSKMLPYWVQRYSHSKGEFINVVQLVMFLFTIGIGNLSEK